MRFQNVSYHIILRYYDRIISIFRPKILFILDNGSFDVVVIIRL